MAPEHPGWFLLYGFGANDAVPALMSGYERVDGAGSGVGWLTLLPALLQGMYGGRAVDDQGKGKDRSDQGCLVAHYGYVLYVGTYMMYEVPTSSYLLTVKGLCG